MCQDHIGKQRANDLLVSLYERTSKLEGIISSFVTPVDSYSNIYVETESTKSIVTFLEGYFYDSSTFTVVPLEDREQLLNVRQEDRTWVRLRDGTLGYVLGPDYEHTDKFLIASPPLLPYVGSKSRKKTRRLYTLDDLKRLMKRSRFPRFVWCPSGTHAISTKKGGLHSFCGPLQVSSFSETSFKFVTHPNPFELRPYFESISYWHILLGELRRDPNLDTQHIADFTTFDFLTHDEMSRLGRVFAATQLQSPNLVSVIETFGDVTEGMVGKVDSVHDHWVVVQFDGIDRVVRQSLDNVIQHFEYAQHVEIISGRSTGISGLVVYTGDMSVTILTDGSSDVVSYTICLIFIVLINLTDNGPCVLRSFETRIL